MRRFTLLSTIAALTVVASPALADNDFSLHLEPGVAIPLTSPQKDVYQPGGVLGVKGMFRLDPHFSIGPSLSTMYLPRTLDDGNAGVLWQFGGSARVQGDRRNTNTSAFFSQFNPWLDVDASMAITGDLFRPAFAVGVGTEMALDQNHIAWMGPFVRYTHTFQTAATDDTLLLDKHDVNILEVGLSFSFDTPTKPKVKKEVRIVYPSIPPCPPQSITTVLPTVVEDKLDLSEKVYFDHDSSVLRWESRDKLDKIVKTLNEHPKLAIDVQGHASSEGQLHYNQVLAVKRTLAVKSYLVDHGVAPTRLVAMPQGINFPAAPNVYKEGRERNRRVEFVVSFTSTETKSK